MMTMNWMTRLGMTRMSPPPLAQPLCMMFMWAPLMAQQQRPQLLLKLNRSLQLPPRLPHQLQLQHRMPGQKVTRRLQAAQGLCLRQAALPVRQRPHDQWQLRQQGKLLAAIAEKLDGVLSPYIHALGGKKKKTHITPPLLPHFAVCVVSSPC